MVEHEIIADAITFNYTSVYYLVLCTVFPKLKLGVSVNSATKTWRKADCSSRPRGRRAISDAGEPVFIKILHLWIVLDTAQDVLLQ